MTSDQLLRTLLSQRPRMPLDQIRDNHPAFKSRSFDYLNTSIARLLDRSPRLMA